MGLLGKLFGGGGKEYPPLESSSAAARRIEKFRPQLEALVRKIDDRYEVVPAESGLYVFLGRPPGMFGIAWFVEGDPSEHNLKTLMQKKGLSQKKIDGLMNRLREAYSERENEPRYSAELTGRKVIVTPSEPFAERLHNILHVMDE